MLFEHPYISSGLLVVLFIYFFIIIKMFDDQNDK